MNYNLVYSPSRSISPRVFLEDVPEAETECGACGSGSSPGSREVLEIGRPDITTPPPGGVDQAARDALLWSEAWNALWDCVKAAVSAGESGTHRKMRVCAL